MDLVKVLCKSQKIVGILRELGATDNTELAETTLKDLNETNYCQLDADLSLEDKKIEFELLEQDVLDRILKEGLEVMIQIVDRAYQEAYYEPYTDGKITI